MLQNLFVIFLYYAGLTSMWDLCHIILADPEPFKKSLISDEYEYSNILMKLPSNIICIHIHAISRVQIYLDICLVNMWHPNIFGT